MFHRSTIIQTLCLIATLIVVLYETTSSSDQARLSEPLKSSFRQLQDQAVKLAESARLLSSGQCAPSSNTDQLSSSLNSNKHATSHWSEQSVIEESEERLIAENQPKLNPILVKEIKEGWKFHEDDMMIRKDIEYPEPSYPPPKGYGALSRSDNPWRERFLVPTYACNEQVSTPAVIGVL